VADGPGADDEAVAIAVGLRDAAGASVAGIEDTSLRALAELEQVLPNHLGRRVDAVRSRHPHALGRQQRSDGRCRSARRAGSGRRDREQVRFDYQRCDGEETRRLVEPHQLVSAGRQWYLVAWDVRRRDWRTFRLDRLTEPQLLLRVVVVHGPADEVRSAVRSLDAEVTAFNANTSTVDMRSESIDWLVSSVAIRVVTFPIEVRGPDPVVMGLRKVSRQLDRAVQRCPRASK